MEILEQDFLMLVVSNNPPVAREIECEKNSVWYNCTSIGFGDDFTRLRVRCTDTENGIVNATFNLTNTPDGYTLFYDNSTSNLGDYWILDDLESVIDDSGEFNLMQLALMMKVYQVQIQQLDCSLGIIFSQLNKSKFKFICNEISIL